MNLPLDGYRTTRLLRESGSTRVYAAIREADQRAVVAKIYELADDESLEARVEHEFRLIHGLEVEGVVRALALERAGTQLAVVLDWCEGVNLEEYAGGRPLALEEFLDIALQLARSLADVHAQRVIHRDIKPTNILIDPETGAVSIADFGISVLLESERERINDPAVVEGTLPYVSPEQTGRTHREVDFRSDLYSLGVTFYELLTGRRPFEGGSPLELIHAHLARRPQPPQWLRPELPTPLSAMIMKLLEKAPERRYQSARGLRLDLERLGEALASGRKIDDFELGRGDVPMTLQLPHRLYGRAVDVELLVREFRQASLGEPRFVLVSGAPGIGKSALIGQLAEPVIGRHGYLARGKFSRELADKPYAGFVAAFRDLAEQLLTETDEQLERWRHEILQVVGPVAGLLCELVPTLRTLLGPASTAPEVGPIEAQNQLALACARLITVFARPEHPLVIALDDLHWSDRSSCELLGTVLAEPRAAVVVVATIRIDELPGGHPIREVIDTVELERDQMLWLDLGPLGREHVAAMVADSLARPVNEVRSLAGLVGRKTNHNPLFIRQFLTHLVELDLLRATAEGWTWDEDAIEQAGIPDDLLGMMTEKLERLDAGPGEVIEAAAVIGTRFDLTTLELLVGSERLAPALVRLVDEGLLTAIGHGRYSFTHDRIRDLAYERTSLAERVTLHRKIGSFRLERVGPSDLSESIFDLVDHIDLGIGLVPVPGEDPAAAAARSLTALAELDEFSRAHLAELNALAGYRSLNGAAAEAAVRYLGAGVRLLTAEQDFPRPGEPGHTLRLALELGLCQAQALAGEHERSRRGYEALLARPLEASDYARVVSRRIESLIRIGDRRGAVEAGVAGLRELGFEIDLERRTVELGSALLRLLPVLRVAELRRLESRGRAEDPKARAAMEVLEALSTVGYFVSSSFHVTVVVTHIRLILEHGRHPTAPQALTQAALVIGVGLGRRELALELIELARALAEREGPACPRHRIEPVRWLLSSWRLPYGDAIEPIRQAAARALEAGDLEFSGYATSMLPTLSLAAGVHLRTLEQISDVAAHRMQQWRATALSPICVGHREFARVLQAGSLEVVANEDPLGLHTIPDDAEHRAARIVVAVLGAQLDLLFGRYRAGWELLQRFTALRKVAMLGAWQVEMLLVTEGLLAASLYARASGLVRASLLRVLDRNRRQLRRYAARGGSSLDAAAALLEAELMVVRGPIDRALPRFGVARRKAALARSPLLEALALERMAEHARSRGLDDLAMGPLREARGRYHYWGAFTKVADLEQRWPGLAGERVRSSERASEVTRTGTGTGTGTSSSTTGGALDLATILKTSQAIAEDLRLEEVVGRVMAIGLENAGADRAVLLLRREGKTGVSAICSTERSIQSFLRGPIPLEQAGERVPISLIHFVERTLEPAVLDDISVDLRFASDPYVERFGVRSVLCLPILKQSRLVGLLYLENKLSPGSFTGDRLEILRLLVTQAASALENAQLYEALRASEVRWRSLVEGLPDIVLLLNRHGRIEFINHLADDSDRARTVGVFAGEFIDAEHIEGLREIMAEVIRTGEQRELELRASFSGLGLRWYMTRLAPIVVDGRVERVIAVGTDVTERREAEVAQQRLEATLRQQQRLESIGTLASGVAHEINNPVQGIMNYAELIATSPTAGEQAREFAAEIGHESQRVATIVRNLLAFSRQEGERSAGPAKVAEIVDGTLSLIRTVLRKDQIALQLDIPEELPEVHCRIQQIQQVLMNLVTNARDAVRARWPEYHDNKRIEIRAATFERERRAWVRVSVHDRGGGVPEDVVPRIFDPFFTTKGRDQGTGLGLAVSHGIVAEHGGKLWLENDPGESACFHVELPASTQTRE